MAEGRIEATSKAALPSDKDWVERGLEPDAMAVTKEINIIAKCLGTRVDMEAIVARKARGLPVQPESWRLTATYSPESCSNDQQSAKSKKSEPTRC